MARALLRRPFAVSRGWFVDLERLDLDDIGNRAKCHPDRHFGSVITRDPNGNMGFGYKCHFWVPNFANAAGGKVKADGREGAFLEQLNKIFSGHVRSIPFACILGAVATRIQS